MFYVCGSVETVSYRIDIRSVLGISSRFFLLSWETKTKHIASPIFHGAFSGGKHIYIYIYILESTAALRAALILAG